MGIRSLTTFLETNNSSGFFEEYELHDCSLVIDGNNICNYLYNWEFTYWKKGLCSNYYGGDYDKYAEIVKDFFQLLLECNVKPYILLDGCNENDQVSKIRARLNGVFKENSTISPPGDGSSFYNIGVVALKYAFMDVITELQLNAYTCLRDANKKMVGLAAHLDCPVLSNDSDFFISGTMMIPFSSIDCQIKENESHSFKFVPCKLYKTENLVKFLNERPNAHYLIPVLLSNEKMLGPFFHSLRIVGNRKIFVSAIFNWLKQQSSLDSAIKSIVQNYGDKRRQNSVFEFIKHTIVRYFPEEIELLLEHFDIESALESSSFEGPTINFKELEEELGLRTYDVEVEDVQGSELFKQKISECQYPAFFTDMLFNDRYFVWPNIEDNTKQDANTIGYRIMSAIHHILVQSNKKQLLVLRSTDSLEELEDFLLPPYEDKLPSIEEIEDLAEESRQHIILKVLELDPSFLEALDEMPQEWHLFLLSLKYATTKSDFDASFISSLILCFITLNYVDAKLKGFYRSLKDLLHNSIQFETRLSTGTSKKTDFKNLPEEEAFSFMQKFVIHFESDPDDNAKTYDRGILHFIAEFQCVFLHLKYLNILLNCPFEDAYIYKILDGTFIYNLTKMFRCEIDVKNYLRSLLGECPSICENILYVFGFLENNRIAN